MSKRRAPSDVTVTYACPRCGGDHPAVECEANETMEPLNARELGRLRSRVLAEVADSSLNAADDEHMRALVALLRAVDSKLGRRVEGPPPSLARRVMLEVERGA